VQALTKTVGISAARVRVLDAFRAARNQSDYGGMSVSDAMAQEAVDEAGNLLAEVRAWLKEKHADLS